MLIKQHLDGQTMHLKLEVSKLINHYNISKKREDNFFPSYFLVINRERKCVNLFINWRYNARGKYGKTI